MALPPIIEKSQRDWLFKVTNELSKQPERDCCLLAFFLGTQCSTLEINRIQVKDILHKSGSLNKKFLIRGKIMEIKTKSDYEKAIKKRAELLDAQSA